MRGGEDNPAQEEFNGLLAHLLPFAQQTLRRYGTFYPFAATMTASGAIAAVAVQVPDEQPTSTAVIAALREALTTETRGGAITAVGICADARLTSPDGSEAKVVVAGVNLVGLAFSAEGEMAVVSIDSVYSLPAQIKGTLLP